MNFKRHKTCYLRSLGLVSGSCQKNTAYAEYGDLACDNHSKHLAKIDARKTGYATYSTDNRCKGIRTGATGGRRCPENKAQGYDFCAAHSHQSTERIQMYRAVGDFICFGHTPMDWEPSCPAPTPSLDDPSSLPSVSFSGPTFGQSGSYQSGFGQSAFTPYANPTQPMVSITTQQSESTAPPFGRTGPQYYF